MVVVGRTKKCWLHVKDSSDGKSWRPWSHFDNAGSWQSVLVWLRWGERDHSSLPSFHDFHGLTPLDGCCGPSDEGQAMEEPSSESSSLEEISTSGSSAGSSSGSEASYNSGSRSFISTSWLIMFSSATWSVNSFLQVILRPLPLTQCVEGLWKSVGKFLFYPTQQWGPVITTIGIKDMFLFWLRKSLCMQVRMTCKLAFCVQSLYRFSTTCQHVHALFINSWQ